MFSTNLRNALAAKLGPHGAAELQEAVLLTKSAVSSVDDYKSLAAQIVRLAEMVDKLAVRVERLERPAKQASKQGASA